MIFEEIMNLAPANKKNFEALEEAIRKNTVVPFTGAGMSYPYYPLWNEALKKLQEQITHDRTAAAQEELASAQTEIDRCDVLEKHLGKNEICRQLCSLFNRSRFTPENPDIGNQAVSLLPKLFPDTPLITTNLDRIQEEVFRSYGVPFDAALNPADEKMLEVLNQRRAHGILYLHGCVSGDLTDYDKLVFSKTQYERHYGENSPLVRELKRWMSGVQLFFLGCSLRNDRTLDILRKVYGKNNRLEHFAILDLKDEDKDFTARMKQLEDDYGIRAILYPEGKHETVRILLIRLINDLGRQAPDMDEKTKEKMQYCKTDFFIGRDSLVEEVVSKMRKQKYRILLVHGVAGIGKTEVCKAAYWKMNEKESSFEMPFIDLNGTGNLLAFCDRLANAFRVKLTEIISEKMPEYLLSAISFRLEGKNRWVYLDNFEDLWASLEKSAQNSLSDYLLKLTKAGLRILISSQVSLPAPAVKQINVKPLDKPDSEKLFLEILDREVRPAEQEAFTTLLNETEGHPLSIVLVANYGRECGSLKELLDSWHKYKIELHIPGERGTHDSLPSALALAWERVKNNRAAVLRWALHVCSLLPLDEQTLDELRDLLKLTSSFSDKEWTEGGRLLRGLGLITTDKDETEQMLFAVKKVFADKTAEEEAIHVWTAWGGELLRQGDDCQSSNYYSCHDRALQWLPQCFRLAELCLKGKYYDNLAGMMQYAGDFFQFDQLSSTDLLGKLLKQVPKDFPLRAMFYEKYGNVLDLTGDHEGAFAAYEEAEKLYQAEHNNLGLANVLQSIGDLLSCTGDLKGALSAYEEAEKLYQAEHYNLGLANVLHSGGDLLSHTGDPEGALAALEEAEKLYQAEHVNLGLANVLQSRGDLLSRTGNLEGAFAAYEEAEKLYQAEHNNLGLANVLQSIGDLLSCTGDLKGALSAYEEAEKLYQAEHYNLGLANVLQSIGLLLSRIGDLDGALAAFKEAERLYQAEHNNLGLANVLRSRGNLLQGKEEWNGVCTYYGKALEIYRQEQDSMSICYTLAELQFCEKQIRKDSDADDHIRELEELLPNQPEPVQEYFKRKIKREL